MRKSDYLPELFKSSNKELFLPFDRIFQDFFRGNFPEMYNCNIDPIAGNYPKVDVIEYKDRLEINAEIAPYYNKDNVKVSVKNDVLTIQGSFDEIFSKKDNTSNKKDNSKSESEEGIYVFREIKKSNFQRSFALAKNTYDDDNIQAKFNNGTLNIKIPFLKKRKDEEGKKFIDIE